MATYTTKVSLGSKKKKRFEKRTKRNYGSNSWKGKLARKSHIRFRKGKIKKVLSVGLGVFAIAMFISIIGGLWYIQKISKDLPSPDAPFGTKNSASVIYDRNGKQLYKVYGNENRDPLELPSDDAKISEVVPPSVIWAFLAAEDINFFEHPGFDAPSTISCGIKNVAGTSNCGGSTLTQQLIKQTVLSSERRLERKIKELILSLQVERIYSKDQILAMYMTVAPMGSNVYGVNTGAKFYFNKNLDELTLAEAAVLAALPQNPSVLSPTLSTDPENAETRLSERKNYVLDQMLKNKDKINKEVGDDEFITEEKIEQARNEVLAYSQPTIEINAPHFVFYVEDVLMKRNYNNGQPFTLAELETGGYKITTTLDYELQKTAEDYVTNEAINVYGARYGGHNAALTTIRPSTGEVLAYVGSKNYNGEKEGKLFDPQVDILTSLQQPGSSAKPITYYNAFRDGVAAPGTQLMDIPIEIGNYKPKNSDGKFTGMNTARTHLVDSRNIPAIILIEATGVAKYIETANTFGYTTFTDPSNYGPSLTLGAGDVKGIEHAEAFGVFANGGTRVQHEVVMKIEDKNGNVVYEMKPEKQEVADPRAIYLVNDVLKGVPAAAPNKFAGDGRAVAAKTGTSEENRDTWYAMYSPDFVTIGWLGNNDNTRMAGTAFGSTSVKPWVQKYMSAILGYFPEKTDFSRPGGVATSQICQEVDGVKSCLDGKDLVIEGKVPPTYMSRKAFRVCDDQQGNIARAIDEQTGHAIDKEFMTYLMPVASLQKYADNYLREKGLIFPVDQCSVDRSPNQGKPWAVVSNPTSGATYSDSLPIAFNAYTLAGIITKVEISIDSTFVSVAETLPYSGNVSLASYAPGAHTLNLKVFDSTGNTGVTTVNFNINKGGFSIQSPTGSSVSSPVTVVAVYTGTEIPKNVRLCVDGTCNISMAMISPNNYRGTWTPVPGTYTIQVKDDTGASSETRTITIIP